MIKTQPVTDRILPRIIIFAPVLYRKNKIMRMRAFQHVLTLDQAYFDNHSASAIRGSMNAHSINNLITWNIPYLVTLNLQFFMTAIYMLRIGKLHTPGKK